MEGRSRSSGKSEDACAGAKGRKNMESLATEHFAGLNGWWQRQALEAVKRVTGTGGKVDASRTSVPDGSCPDASCREDGG